MRSLMGQRNRCTLARPPRPPLSCGFPSGFAHAERPLSLRRHSFASRPQDAPHAFVADPLAFGYYLGGVLSRRANRETAHHNPGGLRSSRARSDRRCGGRAA